MKNSRPFSALLTSALRLSLGLVLTSSTLVSGLCSRAMASDSITDKDLKINAPAKQWPFYYSSNAPYKVRVVEDGITALELRLRMIARAQKKIDVMVYLFGTDNSGEIVLHALMARALEGVHVRLLVDFHGDDGKPDITDEVFEAIQQNLKRRAGPGGLKGSFEMKYYNRGLVLHNPIKMNHRSHAKLINIDDREVIVGGRNIGDDYFSMIDEDVSYLDRDAYVYVPENAPADNIGAQSTAIFDNYWANTSWIQPMTPWPADKPLSNDATWTAQPDEESQAVENTLRLNVAKEADRFLGSDLNSELTGTKLMPTFTTNTVTLVIDRPGHSHDDRLTTYVANSEIYQARRYLLMENYTFAGTTQHQNLLLTIANTFKAPVVLLTNGFETSDSGVLTRFEYEVEKRLLRLSQNLWTLDLTGEWEPNQARIKNYDTPKILATHSKSAVVYTQTSATTLIGSYNFDGRSEILNNEDLLIFENNVWIAQETARVIMNRTKISRQLTIGPDGKLVYADGTKIPATKKTFIEKLANFLGLHKTLRLMY